MQHIVKSRQCLEMLKASFQNRVEFKFNLIWRSAWNHFVAKFGLWKPSLQTSPTTSQYIDWHSTWTAPKRFVLYHQTPWSFHVHGEKSLQRPQHDSHCTRYIINTRSEGVGSSGHCETFFPCSRATSPKPREVLSEWTFDLSFPLKFNEIFPLGGNLRLSVRFASPFLCLASAEKGHRWKLCALRPTFHLRPKPLLCLTNYKIIPPRKRLSRTDIRHLPFPVY